MREIGENRHNHSRHCEHALSNARARNTRVYVSEWVRVNEIIIIIIYYTCDYRRVGSGLSIAATQNWHNQLFIYLFVFDAKSAKSVARWLPPIDWFQRFDVDVMISRLFQSSVCADNMHSAAVQKSWHRTIRKCALCKWRDHISHLCTVRWKIFATKSDFILFDRFIGSETHMKKRKEGEVER